jgi:CubicO group peptidase (beta-lactamase class C family)
MQKKLIKIIVFSIALILIFINFSTITAKENLKHKNTDIGSKLIDLKSKLFDLKFKLYMKLGHMKSVSACIIKNNEIVWEKGYGFSNRARLQRPTIDTNYMAGSISKVITATAIMQLYENESYNFSLDDNVDKYLPFELKNPKYNDVNITFRMLLSHQSSIHDHDSEIASSYLFTYLPFSFAKEILLPDGENYLSECWGNYPPGADANYSNFGFILLGYLIERITGQPYEKYCQEHIFEPLKMHDTSFNMSNIDKSNLAVPYYYLPGFYIRVPKTDFVFLDPAGGLYTTVEDLSHLYIAHLNGGIYEDVQILNESTIELMHTIQYPNSTPYGGNLRFGLGWMIFVDDNNEPYITGHAGDLYCYHARMLQYTIDNTSIIYFYNSGASPIFRNLMFKAHGMIINLLFEKAREL